MPGRRRSIGPKRFSITAWPVGQGLFTQAELNVGNRVFRVVYDCGTLTEANSRIEDCLQSIPRRPLDLLVVSHFHWDHISHIPALLKHTGGTARMWIPYMSPKERVIYATMLSMEALGRGIPPAGYRDPLALINDPEGWLAQNGGGIVEQIGGPDTPPGDPPPDMDLPNHSVERQQDQRSEGIRRGHEGFGLSSATHWTTPFGNPRLRAAWASVFPQGVDEPVLRLITWNKPLDRERLDDIHRRLLELRGGRGRRQGAWQPSQEEITPFEADELVREIARSSRKRRSALSDIYEIANRDLNRTSLCLMAQPVAVREFPWTWHSSAKAIPHGHDWPFLPGAVYPWWLGMFDTDLTMSQQDIAEACLRRCWPFHLHALPSLPEDIRDKINRNVRRMAEADGWRKYLPAALWCGDVNEEELGELLADASDQMAQRLCHTFVWQVPHHGSKTSQHSEFYRTIYPAIGYLSCEVNSRYGHPCSAVVQETQAHVVTEWSEPFSATISWE